MNKHQAEAIRRYTEGRANTLRECALRMQQHIGFVLDRIERGETASIDHYLRGISMDVQEARIIVGALDGIITGAAFASEPETVKNHASAAGGQ